MSLQSMGFEIETFTDGELVSITEPALLLSYANVVVDVGVDVLHYYDRVVRSLPILHCLLALLLGEMLHF